MIQIRQSVFETNSSSSHSIVMLKNDRPSKTIEDSGMVDGDRHLDEEGIMDFWFENDLEFGRSPFEFLVDWYGRLRYSVAYYSNNEDKIYEIEEICRKRIAGFVKFKFQKDTWGQYNHGYVDHQSYGVLPEALRRFNISLEEFIFNDRYIVVIDGDEYGVFDTLVETDLFNKESVENIVSVSDDIDSNNWSEK